MMNCHFIKAFLLPVSVSAFDADNNELSGSTVEGNISDLMLGVFITAAFYSFLRLRRRSVKAEPSVVNDVAVISPTELTVASLPFHVSNFASVHLGTYYGTSVCIKMIRDDNVRLSELTRLCHIRHPHILSHFGVLQDQVVLSNYNANLGIVTEYMPRRSLLEVLRSKSTPQEYKLVSLYSKLRVLKDVAEAMKFLHDRDIINGNLKPSNVLLDQLGRAKICDFGELKVSAVWSSPQMVHEDCDEVSQSTDLYSYGIILWEMLNSKIPWENEGDTQIICRKLLGDCLPLPHDCPNDDKLNELYVMLEQCLDVFPDKRPLFGDICECLKEHLREELSSYPVEYICPISYDIMRDPVICSDGHTYEREAIERWFAEHDTSPLTNVVLTDLSLRQNIVLRNLIRQAVTEDCD